MDGRAGDGHRRHRHRAGRRDRPGGAYTLTWQVISDDGDTIRGTVRFTLTRPAAPSSPRRRRRERRAGRRGDRAAARYARRGPLGAPAVPATEESGVPGWLWGLAGAAVLAVAAGVVVARRARQP